MRPHTESGIARILVPLDGSDFSEHALPHAIALARGAGATVRLVHVHEPLPGAVVPGTIPGAAPSPATSDEDATAWCWQYLDGWAHRLHAEAAVDAVPEVAFGPIVTSLAQVSRSGQVDLIVMTTHGRGGFARAWLGSTADSLVKSVGIPVLLIRPASGAVQLDLDPGIRHIVVTLDGAPLAESILPHVAPLAHAVRAKVTLVTVVPASSSASPQSVGNSAAAAYLKEVATRPDWNGVDVVTRVLTAERAEAGIIHALGELGADMVAMATRGRGGLGRVLLGSVADKVLRGTDVPLLLLSPS